MFILDVLPDGIGIDLVKWLRATTSLRPSYDLGPRQHRGRRGGHAPEPSISWKSR
jgi:hypothetical protein